MARSNVKGRDGKKSAARPTGRGEWVEWSKQGLLGGDKGRIMSQKGLKLAQVRPSGVRSKGERLGQKWQQSPY